MALVCGHDFGWVAGHRSPTEIVGRDDYFTPEGTVLAGNNRPNPNIVKVSDSPPLQHLHPDSTHERDPGAKRSLERARRMSTQDIIDNLRPGNGNKEALRVKPNGVIVNGNARVKVLQERGVDVNSLPREFAPSEGVAFPELGTPKSVEAVVEAAPSAYSIQNVGQEATFLRNSCFFHENYPHVATADA